MDNHKPYNIDFYKKQSLELYSKSKTPRPAQPNIVEKNDLKATPVSSSSPSSPSALPAISSTQHLSPDEQFSLYKKVHPALGKLTIQAFTARRTFPIQDAFVEIRKDFDSGNYILYRLMTNESGLTPTVLLNTSRKPQSLSPDQKEPYATYTVLIKHPDYVPVKIHDVPVFDEITSIQKVDLVPLSANPSENKMIEYTNTEPIL